MMRLFPSLAMVLFICLLIFSTTAPVSADDGPLLVKDLNPAADPESDAYPAPVLVWQNLLYFVADDGVHGSELWQSDGTVAGTVLVKDINPTGSADPAAFTIFQDQLYFAADDGTHGVELWRSDGTSDGTVLVKDIRPDSASAEPANLTVFNNALYFTATSDGFGVGRTGYELWQSDGTAAGTLLFKDIHPNGSSNPAALTIFNGVLYFIADDGNHRQLWRSDGTALGTISITSATLDVGGEELFVFNNALYFIATDSIAGYELWQSNGTVGNATLVKDIQPGTGHSIPSAFALFNSTLYFTADDGVNGEEVWRSDGTEAGTTLVKDINPAGDGVDSASPAFTFRFTSFNGALYFAADDGSLGTELWKTDGTPAGTTLVRDIYVDPDFPEFGDAYPDYLTVFNGALYFAADSNGTGVELWQSDGTSGGTVLFKELNALPFFALAGDGAPAAFFPFNNQLYFQATDGLHGSELWRTDGTPAGTILFADLNQVGNADTGFTGHYAPWQGMLYFGADDGVNGNELWRSDGTAAGTLLLKDLNPGQADGFPNNLIVYRDQLYFGADDGVAGDELWRSDGTPAGTKRFMEINPTGAANPQNFIRFNDLLYFLADDGVHGSELWRSDGTIAGTQRVSDINVGPDSSRITHLTIFKGALYFMADDGSNGYALWRSDGSTLGTALVKDVDPATDNAAPTDFLLFQDQLYFQADDGTNGYELWQSDGTAAGTRLLKNIHPSSHANPYGLTVYQNGLYFSAEDGVNGTELWRSDGTTAGTTLLLDIVPSDSSYPADLIVFHDRLYFTAYTPATDRELWQSDGRAAGTTLFKDLNPTDDPFLGNFTVFNDRLYFRATTGSRALDLWQSDGTADGTIAVTALHPAIGFLQIEQLMAAETALFFVGDDNEHGTELWALTNPDLTITQTVTPTAALAPGDQVTYTIAFRNRGTDVAGRVIITAALPGAVTFTELGTPVLDAGLAITLTGSNPYRWQLSDLPPQQGGYLNFVGQVQQPQGAGIFTSTAQIRGDADFRLTNNQANATLPVRNVAPIAAADHYTTTEDSPLRVTVPSLLQNDREPNGESLTATLHIAPAHGQLALAPTGTFVYTPTANFNGSDTFAYLLSDGVLTATAQALLVVTPVNDPPVANAGIDRTVAVSSTVTLHGRATDPDGPTDFTYTWQQTAGPTVALTSATIAEPSFPTPTTPAVLTFALTVRDGTDLTSPPDTVTITVTDQGLPNYLPLITR